MLNRPRDTDRNVQFGSDSLARRPDLPIDWQPLSVAYRARGSQISAKRFSQFLGERDVVFALNAAADSDNYICLAEIDRLFNFLKRRFRLHADLANFNLHRFDRSTAALHCLVAPERA